MPVYNWYYPASVDSNDALGIHQVGDYLDRHLIDTPASRAIYVHIPFCETICSFCPFSRGRYKASEQIDMYCDALISEIRIKSRIEALTKVPIRAIFFGGGTPSLMGARNLRRVITTLTESFDLSSLEEFSFEMEVKSVDEEIVHAAFECGVTHPRFGLQTFDPRLRELYGLTASLDQIYRAAELLRTQFPFPSFDILYGSPGQTIEEFEADIDEAVSLGIANIDFYPLNNFSVQKALYNYATANGLGSVTGEMKFEMNQLLRSRIAKYGYHPHNGHGYFKCWPDDPNFSQVVSDEYSFVYHEHVYGEPDADFIGFGNSAISVLPGVVLVNAKSREIYADSYGQAGEPNVSSASFCDSLWQARTVSMCLAYHGKTRKDSCDWNIVPAETIQALINLINEDLVIENEKEFALTRNGWNWYANVMFHLLPSREKQALFEHLQSRLAMRPWVASFVGIKARTASRPTMKTA